MGHLMGSAQRLPGYEQIEKVGVGTVVEYHIQTGRQRQGRETFPAMVLAQHPDDGSLDLHVFFEPEDQIWLRRVLPWSEVQPGNSWSPVTSDRHSELMAEVGAGNLAIAQLASKIFGDYEEPTKSVMEHLADFDARLSALERAAAPRTTRAKKGE